MALLRGDPLCRIVSPIGTPIIMDKATLSKSRPTTAKLRVEIDLAKPLVSKVFVEIRNPQGKMEVFEQKIDYETIPAYCSHCKRQGHTNEKCRILHPQIQKVDNIDKGGTDTQRENIISKQ